MKQLSMSLAWLECNLDAVHSAGDHEIAIGRVQALAVLRATDPLLFFQGCFGTFSQLARTTAAS